MIAKFNFSDEKAQMHFSPETLTSKPIQRAENWKNNTTLANHAGFSRLMARKLQIIF